MELLRLLCEGMGLPLDYFEGDISGGYVTLDINHYPACPNPTITLGLPPHCDRLTGTSSPYYSRARSLVLRSPTSRGGPTGYAGWAMAYPVESSPCTPVGPFTATTGRIRDSSDAAMPVQLFGFRLSATLRLAISGYGDAGRRRLEFRRIGDPCCLAPLPVASNSRPPAAGSDQLWVF